MINKKFSITAVAFCLTLASCITVGYATEEVFNEVDTNKDNYLSKEEFRKLASKNTKNAKEKQEAEAEADEEFKLTDTNKDGRVSQREFLDMSMKHANDQKTSTK